MNKKVTLFVAIILVVLIIAGIIFYIFSNKVAVDKEGGILTQKDAVVTQEVSYEKDGTLFKFSKNRLTKTATVEMEYGLTDSDEYTDFLGEQVTMAPFFINLFCGVFNQAMFDPEALEELSEDEEEAKNITEDQQFKNALEGYKISQFRIQYKDSESDENIASCESTQKDLRT